MGYLDRLSPSIELTSPETRQQFSASWIGNERRKEKKLGIFEYPDFNGTRTQDLGVNGSRHTISFYFSGEDNDLIASQFYTACDESGTWTVIHPEKGTLNLQLVSITEDIQPVTDGNIRRFNTEWIEPAVDNATSSTAQLGGDVGQQALQTNETSSEQYASTLRADTAAEIARNRSTITNTILNFQTALGSLTALDDNIAAEVSATIRGLENTLSQAELAPSVIAAQIQTLIQLPAIIQTDIESKINAYADLITTTFNSLPEGNDTEALNAVVASELVLGAGLTAMCQSIISGELQTRPEANAYIDTLINELATITAALDRIQENFADRVIDRQYFSNSGSYADLSRLIAQTIEYLLATAVSLRIEKRFTLDRPRCPIDIVVTEYGSLGDQDFNLDFFIATNNLVGNDIRLLPAGSEVVVYV